MVSHLRLILCLGVSFLILGYASSAQALQQPTQTHRLMCRGIVLTIGANDCFEPGGWDAVCEHWYQEWLKNGCYTIPADQL